MKKSKLKITTLIAAALSGMVMLNGTTTVFAAKADTEINAEQYSSVDELKDLNGGQAPDVYSNEKDYKFIDGTYTNIKVNDEKDAVESLNSIKELMKIDYPDSEFNVTKVNTSKSLTSYKLQQMYNSLPVYGREMVVVTDKDGNTTSVGGNYLKGVTSNTNPTIDKVSANSYALAKYGKDASVSNDELTVYTLKDNQPATLCWKVTVNGKKDGKDFSVDTLVNAANGEIVDEISLLTRSAATGSGVDLTGTKRTFNVNKTTSSSWYSRSTVYQLYDTARKIAIYESQYGRIPGNIITSSTTNFDDEVAVSAMVNLGKTYDYYKNNLQRNSYDDNGASITASVHYSEGYYGEGYDNAYWSPQDRQFVFGDGDKYFTPLSGALDVIGHEFTHAVVETTANLQYQGQSGALNEAYADIMGNFIEGDNDSKWLIGEDIMKNGDAALRSMSRPEDFKQPSTVGGQYYANPNSSSDNGGVHTNSGILNHAAYLMWKNGITDKAKLADLFYNSLLIMNSRATFKDSRTSVLSAAKNMNMTSSEIEIIKDAFDEVGVTA